MSYFGVWYKDICNELQQNGELKKLEVEFNQQTSDNGRISLLYKRKDLGKNIEKGFKAKCNKKSEQFRNLGNKYYSRKEFNRAITAYSNSISYGIENGKELSLAYSNRSVVFYVMKEYNLAQSDINMAFEKGYPSNLHYKLYERLGRCLMETGYPLLASNAFKNGLASLNKSELEVARKKQLANNLSELCIVCEDTIDKKPAETTGNYEYKVAPPTIPDEDVNEIYPCASKAFTIVDNDNEGRHAVATRDIPIGEVIIIEKPFTSICLSSCLETHCYNCLSRFKISYPCRSCASVRFCSSVCENKCWDSFHCYECEYYDLLSSDDIGLSHLALKMIIQVGINELREFATRSEILKYGSGQGRLGTNESGIYDPSDYYCVHSLIGNSEVRKSSDLFRRSLIAIYLCNILCKTGFINGATLKDDYCVIGSHLLKQIQMLPCNAHEVSELQLGGEDIANSVLKEIGSAAYTTLSLLNHSCDPSVVRHCYGDICVLRAIKYIKKGEPIIDNYGHLYPVEERADRQKNLSEQYYFDCQCTPCIEDWPSYNDITQEDPKFVCCKCNNSLDTGMTCCKKCNYDDLEVHDFDKLQADYQQCMENVLSTGEYAIDLPILLNYLNLLSRKAKLPVIHFNNCQEIVKLCFGLQGNYMKLKF